VSGDGAAPRVRQSVADATPENGATITVRAPDVLAAKLGTKTGEGDWTRAIALLVK
jgi:hypothetical protein